MQADTPAKLLGSLLGLELAADISAEINGRARATKYPAGHTILREGEAATALHLIRHGLVRGYYLDEDGNDVTKCFAAENEFFSTEGLRTGGASSFTIEALEPCEAIALPYGLVKAAAAADSTLADAIARWFEAEVARLEQRGKDLLTLDATGRYTAFCARHPGLHTRVPLQHIASYIGIRPASLSRIRRKMYS